MDIEAIVKKYVLLWEMTHPMSVEEAMTAALTELAAGYEATVANLEQRIRQMEGVMVPDDSGLEFALEQLVNVCNNYNDACNWSETISAEAALEKLYKRRLAAAQQPKKEGE